MARLLEPDNFIANNQRNDASSGHSSPRLPKDRSRVSQSDSCAPSRVGDIEKQDQSCQAGEASGKTESRPVSDDSDSEAEVVDFKGPEDPANPYNWSKSKKWSHGGVLSIMSFVTPVASTMFAPGVPEAMQEFGTTNQTLGSFVVSIYLLGNAFGREYTNLATLPTCNLTS